MLSLMSIFVIAIGTFVMSFMLFILGRLEVKRRYLATIVGVMMFIVFSIAFYINDYESSVFSLVSSGLISIFCGVIAYFALGIAESIKKR